jgi:PadR family transcriptional regulator, regulatory protein PadR
MSETMSDRHHARHGGDRHRGRIRSFLQPRVLLLLAQKPAHGYELMERLSREEGGALGGPGLLYRTLRHLEEEGLVRSSWDTGGNGPARRVYEITDEGRDTLHAWVVTIRRTRERLERFLADYERLFQSEERR